MQPVEHLPPSVRSAYLETHAALCSGLPILAGIGIRLIVETVCKDKETVDEVTDKKAKYKLLETRIDELVEKQLLTPTDAGFLQRTRLVGNKAAHEALQLDEVTLNAAMDVAEHLLRSAYLLPKIADRLLTKPE